MSDAQSDAVRVVDRNFPQMLEQELATRPPSDQTGL